MTIELAQLYDCKELNHFEKKLFSAENFPLSYGSFYYHIQNNLLYVAKIRGVIVGYILTLVKRKTAKIYSIGVSKLYRKRKISTQLLQKTLFKLQSLNFQKVVLEVRVDNTSAIQFYEKNHFKSLKTIHSFYQDGCDAYFMEKTLAN
ncbi:MAG: GNAT family N-acetyltransferase [Campylobacterales bacterium]|nr:GNAT family N-acetyltransferase [Campylobacterales bacterium]